MTTPTRLDTITSMIQSNSSRNSALADSAFGDVSQQQPAPEQISDELKSKLIAWVKAEYEKMKSDRLSIQRQWYLNLSMFYGRQYFEMMATGDVSKLSIPKAPPYRTRHTVNIIRPMIRTEIARMTSQKPTATCTPATTSDEDMFAAQAGEQVWEYLQQRRKFHHIMQRNAFWIANTGTGFIKTWWDQSIIDKTSINPETGEPVQGDVNFGVLTPFNIFVPDLLQEEIEDEPYVFEAYTRSVEWVKKFWGITVNANVASKNEIIETSYMNVKGGNSSKPDSVLVIEAWVKPGATSLLPEGGMLTVVGEQLVQGPVPFYSHGEFPYAKFDHIPSGKFYGDSVLVDVNHLQKEYNRTRSEIIESKRRMAKPQLLYAIGSIDPHRVTNEPGLMIPYQPGLPTPTPLPIQPLPSYVLQEQDRIRGDFEDITGQHQVSRGSAPGGGVTAATAISFLQERDDSIMGMTYASIERGTEKIARQALDLVVDYWTLPRTIGVTGLDQSFDSYELKGSDISNGRNIRVEGGSALPVSKAARQALLMDLTKMGVISGDQMLDMLDVGGVNKLTERIRVDLRQAQRENLKMKKITREEYNQYMSSIAEMAMNNPEQGAIDPNTGLPVIDPSIPATYPPMIPVNDWDNHSIHLATHNNYRKSQSFELLPDFVRLEFQKHCALHKQALQQQQMEAMMGGMPPGAGGESPSGQTSGPPGQPQGSGMMPPSGGQPPEMEDQGMPPEGEQ